MSDNAAVLAKCTNVLTGHGPRRSIAETLRGVAEGLSGDEYADTYGAGEYIEDFEREIAAMFGKEAAVFMPSGTMAQQIALRIWCDRGNNHTIAMHPTSHLEFAEQLGYQFLHGIHRLQFGVPELLGNRLLTPGDFEELGEKPGAVLLELPCRPLGGALHPWEDLLAIQAWARGRNIPLHLDGARIWQCRGFYGKTFAEIGELFDSIYVSFYKDLGGLCGCMLVGPDDFIRASRVWQRRYGGNLFTQSPFVASARVAVEKTLPNLEDWVIRAREVASAFTKSPGVSVYPDPPHVNFFRLYIAGDHERLNARHLELADETGTWLFGGLGPSAVAGIATTEIHVWENAMRFDLQALQPFMERLLQ